MEFGRTKERIWTSIKTLRREWRKRRLLRGVLLLIVGSILIFGLLCLVFPLPSSPLDPSPSLRLQDREGRLLRLYLSSEDAYCLPIDLDHVSPYLLQATCAYEDRWFNWHPGINAVSTFRALLLNVRAGRIVSGGSTISQQVARMMRPSRRTVAAKIVEAFRALQLEAKYNKREILGFYLNLAPYGGNIIGAEAASLLYFGKAASALNPGEAALLAALPTSPTRLRPDIAPDAAKARRDIVLQRMLGHGDIDKQHYEAALVSKVPCQRVPLPRYAPHFSDEIAKRNAGRGGVIYTTIDLEVQQLAERLLERRMKELSVSGVTNGAVVIIDNSTTSLLAMVGSADYGDTLHAGQVNGASAVRSPGSTLKPFVYGIALDRGMITTSTLLEDIPVNFSGYTPVNYDERFQGIVTVEQALRHSMNVPVVNLTRDLGLDHLVNFLRNGGISTLDQTPGHYGLSLVIGGVGIQLVELTTLYSGLANGGVFNRLRMSVDDPVSHGERLLTPGATFILTDMLTHLKRPDFPTYWQATTHRPKIAWKTGTSYGHRDAWSMGYTPRYTAGVWFGNFDAMGNPVLVGAEAAAPLLFDLFDALETEGGSWFSRPPDVEIRNVCALSGQLPGPHCGTVREEYYLPERSPVARCGYHVSFWIDDLTGTRLCPHCRVGRSCHRETFVQWPPAIATWMSREGAPTPSLPAHFPDCPRFLEAKAPEIRSPAADCSFILRRGIPLTDQRIPLEAAVTSDVKLLYWFVDGALLAKVTPEQRLFYIPEAGTHELICMDDEGRQSKREVVIRE